MTEVGSIIGTAQYLSPEQARGAPVDQTSDLYSVGVVLYEMLTGQVPFTGDTPLEIAMKHLSEVPRAAVRAAARGAARPRLGRPARAGQGSRRALPERRGDGRRPRARGRGPAGRPRDRDDGDGRARRLGRAGRRADLRDLADARTPAGPRPCRPGGRRPPATTATRARRAGAGRSGRGCSRCCCCSPPPAAAWFAYTKIQDQLNANKPVAGAVREGADRAAGGQQDPRRRPRPHVGRELQRHRPERDGHRPEPPAPATTSRSTRTCSSPSRRARRP